MKEIKKEIEVEASIKNVYDVFLHYPTLNPYESNRIIWTSASTWKEIRDNEVERCCQMKANKDENCVVIYIFNNVNSKTYQEKIILKAIGINENKTKVEISSMAGENLSSKIGHHIRRYSIDLWMDKLIEKVKVKVEGR